jgi:hypothetical protein
LNSIVVVGDSELLQRARQLLPGFQVIGITDEPDLGDPASSLGLIRALIETGRAPDAVICAGVPSFTLLGQLHHYSAGRCFVDAAGSIWPPNTLRWIAEAAGMAVLPSLEAIPAALLGRAGPPGAITGITGNEGSSSSLELAGFGGGIAQREGAGAAEVASPPHDYAWASEPPIQVPPAPVQLRQEEPDPSRQVIDAGMGAAPQQTAYLPTDLLRQLRPRNS